MAALFFTSGASALIYEVLWVRRLTLTLGHSVLAICAVLTIFMGGLAWGGLLAGRWADRRAQPGSAKLLLAYARLEAFIGAWGLLSLALLWLSEHAFLTAAQHEWSGLPLYLVGFLGGAITLLPATIAMGATLPLLTRYLVHHKDQAVRGIASLYGWNTLGGVAGSLLAGYLLLPGLGSRWSLVLAAVSNFWVAYAAWSLSGSPAKVDEGLVESPPPPSSHSMARLLLAMGLLGAVSMMCQAAWTRGLVLTLGSSIYAFSAILATFLTGIAVGSLVCALLGPRLKPGYGLLGGVELALAATIVLTSFGIGQFPLFYVQLMQHLGSESLGRLVGQLLMSGILLGPTTFLMGLAFPLAAGLLVQQGYGSGTGLARVYAANTVGCVLGAFVGGYILMPAWGAQAILTCAAALATLAALVLLLGASSKSRWAALPAAGLLLALAARVPAWDQSLMSAGVSIYGADWGEEKNLASKLQPPAFYRDGLSSTVSVHLNGAYRALRVNGKVDASLHQSDRQTMYLTGYLGGLLHLAPKTAAVIGLGSGMTLEALSQIPGVESIDCAEIEPAVVEAADYWRAYNRDVLRDPRVKVRAIDGRTFLLSSSQRYDLILSEPSNPWVAGIASLFSLDFYRTCRQRLRPGGLMVQWFHLYSVSEREVGMVLRTFFDVFPEGQVWVTAPGDIVLIGAESPPRLDLEHLRRVYNSSPALRQNWFDIDLFQAEGVLGHFLMSREQALKLFSGEELNTDDRPLLEFLAPLRLLDRGSTESLLDLLFGGQTELLPPGVEANDQLLEGAAQGWLTTGNLTPLRRLLTRTAGPRSALLWARLSAETGEPREGRTPWDLKKAGDSDDPLSNFIAAEAEHALGHWPIAEAHYRQAVAGPLPGGEGQALLGLGLAVLKQDRWEEAAALFQRSSDFLAGSAALTYQGDAFLKGARYDQARAAYRTALERNPSDLMAHFGLGQSDLAQDRFASAAEWFQTCLKFDPSFRQARLNLGVCQERLGQTESAQSSFEEVLRLFPGDRAAKRNLDILR